MQILGYRNMTQQKLSLNSNSIGSAGVGVLLKMMEQNCHHITDLNLCHNSFGDEGASLLARSLGKNAIPNLTHLSLSSCDISDDEFITLVSSLEQNTSLLQLDLRYENRVSERAFLVLAESLPEIKVLQRLYLSGWYTGLASAMPLLLAGLRKNTSLLFFNVADCVSYFVPLRPAQTDRCAGGWMREMERLAYRNCFLPLIRTQKKGFRLVVSGLMRLPR
jgi:Ran GTPase-activating protein (RanGAP) involved in mRNA processing and transport